MLFALTDFSLIIEAKHLEAALAWVRYARQSVRFVFAPAAQVAESEATAEAARKILDFLEGKPEGVDRTALIDECFKKRGSVARIDEALHSLLLATPPRIELIEKDREDGRGGRKRKIYRIISGVNGVSEFDGRRGLDPTEFSAEFGAGDRRGDDEPVQTPLTPPDSGVWENHGPSQTPQYPQTPPGQNEIIVEGSL